jgi:hypothetical protein
MDSLFDTIYGVGKDPAGPQNPRDLREGALGLHPVQRLHAGSEITAA